MNSQGINLKDVVVVMKVNTMTGTTDNPITRMVKLKAGKGLSYESIGVRMFGKFVKNPVQGNEMIEVQDEDIERIAMPSELELVPEWKNI
jgi:hypothetical protein